MTNVYWITGLSGAGKTTLGKALYNKMLQSNPNTVLLDGDDLRKIFDTVTDYSTQARKNLAMSYSRLCHMLSRQGINVIICTISMFHDVHKWNRKEIDGYVEIYLKTSLETLRQRDGKGLYAQQSKGTIKNLVGIDIQAEEPINPDLIVETDSLSIDDVLLNVESFLAGR